jgi:Tfp pilus assembly protein PilF
MGKHATAPRRQTAQSIQTALALHQQGRLSEAGHIYDLVLAGDPRNFDALHLSGVLKHQQGRSAEALRLVAAALSTQPGSADALTNYGIILAALAARTGRWPATTAR